ncbi:MAG: acetamidase/formamidase family protein [Nitrososphaerota archaeon]
MKIVPKDKGVYSFSRFHKPVEYVDLGETIILETEDAVGGQVRSEGTPLEKIDWRSVNKATGPIYINGVERGDTLIVDILDIDVASEGVILVVPGAGALAQRDFKPKAKIIKIKDCIALFNDVPLIVRPMIGTIGVAPEGDDVPTGVPYKHGGNLDCVEVCRGARLYLPVAVDGALFAAGDLHAVQADGELCVSSIEVEGRILLRFNAIKGMKPEWPIVELGDHYSILTADEDMDRAVEIATEYAVQALMKSRKWSFEEAYMFGSLVVDIAVNQVVDPKKGVRATIPKNFISIHDLLNSSV